MQQTYFQSLYEDAKTGFWINNPTYDIARKAIAFGAINCTTNPAYLSKLINTNMNDELMNEVHSAIKYTSNNDEAVDYVQTVIVSKIADIFIDTYKKNPGRHGFVSLQGNPHKDKDAANIAEEAIRYAAKRENIIPKIPTTKAGIEAIETLVERNLPIIATEVMSIAQTKAICEAYVNTAKKTNNAPPLFVTHITGIFDEFLMNEVIEKGIDISSDLLMKAGTIIAYKQYKMMEANGYPGIMLGGGARKPYHFTNFIGLNMDITINWSTAEQLLNEHKAIKKANFDVEQKEIDELLEKVPTFKKAYDDNGLDIEEFEEYGPVCYFRDSFVKGWDIIADLVEQSKA